MALKVRPDVFFVRATGGTWIRNDDRSVWLSGDESYDLLRSLFSELSAGRTAEEVFEGVAPSLRIRFEHRVVEPLLRAGMLIHVRSRQPLDNRLAKCYANQLAFLERYTDDPAGRLLQVRRKSASFVGRGPLLRAVLVAAVDLGLARVNVHAFEDETGITALRAIADSAHALDADFEWSLKFHPSEATLHDLAATSLEPSDAFVLACDDARDIDADEWNRGVPLGIVAGHDGLLLATPLLDGEEGWCWGCLRLALGDREPVPPGPPACALAAFQLVQRLFCRFAGAPVPEDRTLTTVSVQTLDVVPRVPRPHPGCRRHGGVVSPALAILLDDDESGPRRDLASAADGPTFLAEQERISRISTLWTDPVLGPLLALGEQDFNQVPLSTSRCVLRGFKDETITVTCAAMLTREARNQAVLFALEELARDIVRDGRTFGAGWTWGEAAYRARLATALLRADPPRNASPASIQDSAWMTSPFRCFVRTVLDNSARRDLRFVIDEGSDDGFTRAFVFCDDDVLGRGAGIDKDDALDHALLDAAVRFGNQHAARTQAAYPSPSRDSWRDLHDSLDTRSERIRLIDARAMLPFLGGDAYVVALDRKGAALPS